MGSIGYFPEFEAIGTQGLRGAVNGPFLHIQGPCEQGHTMNLAAAAELHAWLGDKLLHAVSRRQMSVNDYRRAHGATDLPPGDLLSIDAALVQWDAAKMPVSDPRHPFHVRDGDPE